MADGGDLSRIADHVALLQASAATLADMPDGDKRADVLAAVNARVDALVLPQLNAALSRDDADALRTLVDVFGRLGRLNFLTHTFAASRVRMPCLVMVVGSPRHAVFVHLHTAWVAGLTDRDSPSPPALPACAAPRRLLPLPPPLPHTHTHPAPW